MEIKFVFWTVKIRFKQSLFNISFNPYVLSFILCKSNLSWLFYSNTFNCASTWVDISLTNSWTQTIKKTWQISYKEKDTFTYKGYSNLRSIGINWKE